MATVAENTKTVRVHRVYIKATPQAVWDALNRPDWTLKCGYAALQDHLGAGRTFGAKPSAEPQASPAVADVIIDGEVVEATPSRKLIQTWHRFMDLGSAAEESARLTYDIEPIRWRVTKLTLTHDVSAVRRAAAVPVDEHETSLGCDGWHGLLGGFKTLLETGSQVPFQGGLQGG